MQQSPIRWRGTKALFFVQSGLWNPYSLRRRGAIGCLRRCFWLRPRDRLCGAWRAAGALRCRELLRPAYLYRLLRVPQWVSPACGKGPRDSRPAGPKVRPQVPSARQERGQAAGAGRAALHYVRLGPGFSDCCTALPAQLPAARSCLGSPGGLAVFSCSRTGPK